MPNDYMHTVQSLSENKFRWQHHSCVVKMMIEVCLQEAELERYTTVPPLEQLLGEEDDSSQAHIKVLTPVASSKVVLFFFIHVVPRITLLNE